MKTLSSLVELIPPLGRAIGLLAVAGALGWAGHAGYGMRAGLPAAVSRNTVAIDSLRPLQGEVKDLRELLVCYIRAEARGASAVFCID